MQLQRSQKVSELEFQLEGINEHPDRTAVRPSANAAANFKRWLYFVDHNKPLKRVSNTYNPPSTSAAPSSTDCRHSSEKLSQSSASFIRQMSPSKLQNNLPTNSKKP